MRTILAGVAVCAFFTPFAHSEEGHRNLLALVGLADSTGPRATPEQCNASEQCDACGQCDASICEPECIADVPFCAISPRLTVRGDFGDGVGYTRGFSYLEGFLPIYQPTQQSLLFGDLRVVNFHDTERWEFNAGGGYRTYAERIDAVCGVNVFYDGRRTDQHFFHQVGVGVEALFGIWEARCNGYIIAGDQQQLTSESLMTTTFGNLVTFDRFRSYDVAMGGVDGEFGVHIPVTDNIDLGTFVGCYHYSADDLRPANGFRARLEAWFGDNWSVHFAAQHDQLFGTTVNGGVAFHFGGKRPRYEQDGNSVQARLGQRVVRDVNMVIAQKTDVERSYFIKEEPKLPVEVPTVPDSPTPAVAAVSEMPSTGDSCETPPVECKKETVPVECKKETPPVECKKETPPCPPPVVCLPFPGRPGDPCTFPGHHFPPGFHHDCFPGKGRYKHVGVDWRVFCGPACGDRHDKDHHDKDHHDRDCDDRD